MCKQECECKKCNHRECKCPCIDNPDMCLFIRLDGHGLQECNKEHQNRNKNGQ